jgi:hypothetical protein
MVRSTLRPLTCVSRRKKTALLIPSVETLLLMVQVHTFSNVCSVINLRGQNWRGCMGSERVLQGLVFVRTECLDMDLSSLIY